MVAHLGYYHGLGILGRIRIPSLIAGVLAVPLVYLLGRELIGHLTGIVTAALVAVSPLAVWYSREGRMYAMPWLFVLVSYWLMLRAQRSYVRVMSLPVLVAVTLGSLAAAAFLVSIGDQAVLLPRALGATAFGFVMAVAVAAHVWRPLLAVVVGLVTISVLSVSTLEAKGSTGQFWNQIAAQLQRQAPSGDVIVTVRTTCA